METRADAYPRRILIMGVAGAGKSTLGAALAARLGYAFVDGDALHPPSNIAKMAKGVPLDDSDRAPWLDLIADTLAAGAETGCVLACSALKLGYRDLIRRRVGAPVVFIHLDLDEASLRERLRSRQNHFMPISLLHSQLAAFERPGPDEAVVRLDARRSTPDQVDDALAALGVR